MERNAIYEFSCDPTQLSCNFGKSATVHRGANYPDPFDFDFTPYESFRNPEYQDAEALKDSLNKAYLFFAPTLPPKKAKSLKIALDRLFNELIAFEDLSHPFLDMGCYKECYELNDDFIVKFCSSRNDTAKEKDIYEAALGNGVDQFFMPSYYSPLFGFWYPLINLEANTVDTDKYLEEDEDEDNVYVEHFFSALDFGVDFIIQPKYDCSLADYLADNVYKSDYIKNASDLKALPYELPYEAIARASIHSVTYLEKLEEQANKESILNFLNFLGDNAVCDLHSGNICFYNDEVLLLDWLS